jgi:FMN phosphatase YigB (HAD superfamily)
MKVFFDFDDVLFETKRFKEDYLKLFQKHGISESIFEEHYYDPLDKNDIKNYNPDQHIQRICHDNGLDSELIAREIGIFIRDTKKYVFNDVEGVLERYDKNDLTIISFSRTNFQKNKIDNSGIANFFREIVIVNTLKGEKIQKMIEGDKLRKDEPMFFIDDRVEQLEDAKNRHPGITTILCKRKEGRYCDRKTEKCDYVIRGLAGLEEIIKIN